MCFWIKEWFFFNGLPQCANIILKMKSLLFLAPVTSGRQEVMGRWELGSPGLQILRKFWWLHRIKVEHHSQNLKWAKPLGKISKVCYLYMGNVTCNSDIGSQCWSTIVFSFSSKLPSPFKKHAPSPPKLNTLRIPVGNFSFQTHVKDEHTIKPDQNGSLDRG